MNYRMFPLVFLFCFYSSVRAQVLMEDNHGATVTAESRGRIAGDSFELRRKRKVGAGFSVLGPSGVGGLILELNLSPENSFIGGFGMGSGFQTFHFQVKHIFGGTWLAPYASGGFAHWYTTGPQGPMSSTQPSFLGDHFLSAEKLQRGDFHENIIFPALGIQYLQLSGDFAGASLYAEVVGLMDLNSMTFVPTGSGGMLYYF